MTCSRSEAGKDQGIIQTDFDFFDQVKIGDVLVILPIHSCLTVNLLGKYLTLEGKTIISMLYSPTQFF
jgi:D-serine deaminase-like pyridoxal phosphate-dependent protein